MAKKIYCSDPNQKARNGIKLCGSVNGIARKIVKGYCSDPNGFARVFWDNGSGWRQETDIPYDMFKGCAVTYHGKIHIFGGNASDVQTNHYSWDGETWTQKTSLPQNMTYPSAVVFGDKIHIFSGYQHYTWQDIGGWTQLNDINHSALIEGNCHAVIYKGKITLVSSNSGHYGWWRYVCVWNESSDDWTLSNVVGGAVYYNAAALNNLVYLLGNTNNQPYKIWDGTNMVDGESMYNFKYGSTVNYNHKIHLLGTQAGTGAEANKRHYAFNGSTFDEREKTPYPFYYGSACVFKNRIHIFGGMDGSYYTDHWSYGEDTKDVWSTIYPNAEVSTACTVETNNGNRTPVTKVNDGDAIVFIATNSRGSGEGGNWFSAVCVAKTREAVLLSAPTTGTGATKYTINGTDYYVSYQSTNATWGGGTQFDNPLGLPVFQNFYLCAPNGTPTSEKVMEIIDMLGIQVKE